MVIDGVFGEVLYPSQGLFYYKVADPALFSAICRAYNDWLAEFCSADPERLKGIAMINVDDVADAVGELERTAKLGFVGGMIAEYPLEERRYDHPDYEPLWAAAAALKALWGRDVELRRLDLSEVSDTTGDYLTYGGLPPSAGLAVSLEDLAKEIRALSKKGAGGQDKTVGLRTCNQLVSRTRNLIDVFQQEIRTLSRIAC